MTWRRWLLGSLAGLVWALWAMPASAEFRVANETPAPQGGAQTLTLGLTEGDAETVDVFGWRRYRYYGGYSYRYYRPYSYSYRYYYAPRYYNYSYRYYRPYYYSYRPSVYPYYASRYYYPRSYYYSYPYYSSYCPISAQANVAVSPPEASYPSAQPQPPVQNTQPPAQVTPPKQEQPSKTYPYDGGPAKPVPMPQSQPKPPPKPQPTAPLDGRAVSLPTRFAYPAYGEAPVKRTSFAQDRTIPVGGRR